MVQRKIATKLSLQADHLKTESLLQHQDLKSNKGADLKKKMKKSGSIKRPKQPGKPPPTQPPAVKTTATPNYMKSTTSSDARKEQSQPQVTTRNHTASPHSSSLRRKSCENSKLSLSSSKKPTKTSLARTLTKNPSFKPARTNARKCSPVVLCENFDVQKATCSSTLKDCKFPAYLSLNPGGTESEGTSAIKVCPYTYCSLNGHHHAPLPPLKCFLSARRRMIKTQRSVKLGCLSPRRVKPVGDDGLTEEQKQDFFIEIYSKGDEDAADSAGIGGSESDSSIVDLLPSVDETAAEDQEEQVVEMLPDAPVCDDFDAYEAFDQNRDVKAMDIGNTYLSEQKQEVEVDEVSLSPPLLVQEERNQDELPEESTPNVHFYEQDSEASDMEWETGHHSALHLDYDYECSPETDVEPDPEADTGEICITNDEFMIESDIKDCCFNEFSADEVSQESYEESLNSDAFSSSDDGEFTGSYGHLKSPSCDEENNILLETQSDNLDHKSLPNEDATEVMGDQDSNLENSNGNNITSSNMTSTEAECCINHEVKAENAEKPETEYSDLARITAKSKKLVHDSDELGSFNPREPNFLPLEPDAEGEKVDLRHQDLDERKNAEEWMVDYALRQAVTKLGPARKKKVALLVEAFEKVMPVPKCDLHLRHNSAFDQARPMQACS